MPLSGVLEIFSREFDQAYEDGGLFLLTMHPHCIGHSSRIQILDELIQYIRGHSGVWFARHDEVAAYVKEKAGL
jgi:peptidoglycan/xylan/chitin deacetylase (PgdA/CDA1 family)